MNFGLRAVGTNEPGEIPLRRLRRVCALLGLTGVAAIGLANAESTATMTMPQVDVLAVLDNSGSMRTNDPSGLMKDAMLNFAGNLADNSQLGVVVFDTKPTLALPMTNVGETGFRIGVTSALHTINYSGKLTDIPGAVEMALYELRLHGRKGSRHVIVVFTDGYVDLGDKERNEDRTRWLTTDLVDEAKSEHVAIYGIAFTDQADFQLLQSLTHNTEGQYFKVPQASDIAPVFGAINAKLASLPPVESSSHGHPSPKKKNSSAWIWRSLAGAGLVLLLVAICWHFLARRPSIPVIASLQDIGRHTAQPVWPIDKSVFRIGSLKRPGWNEINDIVIPYSTVSRSHAEIQFKDGHFALRDLQSKNHTFHNGTRLQAGETVEIHRGDRICFDAYEFRFLTGAAIQSSPRGGGLVTELSESEPSQNGSSGEPRQLEMPPARGQVEMSSSFRSVEAGQTSIKPIVCPNHPGRNTQQGCPMCSNLMCDLCVEPWNGYHICANCRSDIIASASPERVREILEKLEYDRINALRTLAKPD